jgi:hypothetical protein
MGSSSRSSDCSFYLNSSKLFEDDSLGKNTYYIHFVRRMRAGRKFWCTWKDESQSILILQVFHTMEFKKIFKKPKMTIHKNDKFWMGSIKLEDEDILTEGFYTFYHTKELKGGILSAAGTKILQICYEEI